jgi:hypothetical protein
MSPHFAFLVLLAASIAACGGAVTAGSASSVGDSDGDPAAPAPVAHAKPPRPDAGVRPLVMPVVDGAAPQPAVDAGSTTICVTDADCGANGVCTFPIGDNICTSDQTGTGSCLATGEQCNGLPTTAIGCSCEGNDVTWEYGCNGVPASYAPAGIVHLGACADAAVPVIPCVGNEECPQGWQCGYEITLACEAAGRCVPPSAFGLCACAATPACACDGTTEYLSCCARYAEKPIALWTACDGGL